MINTIALICCDCHIINGTGDTSSFDYYYKKEEAEARVAQCLGGLKLLSIKHDILSSGELSDEFSRSPCQCCGSSLAGERYELIVVNL